MLPGVVSADVESVRAYEEYHFEERLKEGESLEIWLTKNLETRDACNEFSMSGAFRRVSPAVDGIPAVPDWVADFGIVSTKIHCRPLDEPRMIHLESEREVLRAEDTRRGTVYGMVLVPEGFTLHVERP